MRNILMTMGILALSATSAFSATFSDFASFDAAVDISVTEDFESLGVSTIGLAGPKTVPSGITVSSQSNQLFVVGPGQSSNLTTGIGSNSPGSDTLSLDLGGVFDAFGAEFFQNNGGGIQGAGPAAFTVFTFLVGALVETFNFSVLPNGGSFFGFTSASLFDEVEVVAGAGSVFEVIDNVSLGQPAAVIPLPAGLPLLMTAMGGLALLRRRRA